MTRAWPGLLVDFLWLLWLLYWLVAARAVKPVRRREPVTSRLAFLVLSLLGIALLVVRFRTGWLAVRLVGGGWIRYGIAVALVAAGLSFAIWARRVLGGNWSGTVTVKVDHELVQSGPYRRIRHPIYTGLLIAILGSGLAAGRFYGLLAFVCLLVALVSKLRVEERWITAEFGERYARYRASSYALLPYVY